MKNLIQMIALVLMCSVIFASFAACGNSPSSEIKNYESAQMDVSYAPTGYVAENDRILSLLGQ